MASTGVFALTRFTALAAGDIWPIVDISDPTQNAHGSLLSMTTTNLFATIPVPVIVTSGTITASAPAFSATQTWNAGGVTFTGIKLNVTATASAAESLLVDLQLAGVSKFLVTKYGRLGIDGAAEISTLKTAGRILASFSSNTYIDGSAVSQRVDTAIGGWRLFLDAYSVDATSNACLQYYNVAGVKADTFVMSNLGVIALINTVTQALGTVTVSTPALTSTATWNDGAVTFTHIFANITSSASAAASQLIDLQVGSASKFAVTKAGALTAVTGILTKGAVTVTADSGADIAVFKNSGAGGITIAVPDANNSSLHFASPGSNAGAIVRWNYDANAFQVGTNNTGGTVTIRVDANVAALTFAATGTAKLLAGLSLSNATAPTHGIQFGTSAPGALANGQIWYDGTDFKVRLAGATKTITVA